MRIQDALSNCCDGAKSFASGAVEWMSKAVTATGAFIGDSARKVADFAKPHFENLKTFAQQNRESLVIGTIGVAIGAVVTAIIAQVFCRGTGTPVTGSTTAAAV
jgi:hypothetical protein